MNFKPVLLLALLSAAGPASAEPPRIFACSHQGFAQGTTSGGPDSIRESRKVVYFNDDLRDLELGYANYIIGTTGEYNGGQGEVNIKFGLEYAGKFYPFSFKGQRLATCADGATITTDPLPIAIKAGTYGAIRSWEQKTHPDAAKNQWLWSTEGDPAFNEGSVFHSDATRDWTLGGAPGETAAVSWSIDAGGAVTPKIEQPGEGIKSGGVTIGILDSQRKGSGFGYIATTKNGGLAGWYQKQGGSHYSPDTAVGPTGMGGYGAGGPVQLFGPSVITGTPVAPKTSVLLLGDSIAAGFGSSDKRGDIWRNFGIYARAMSKKYNVCNAAIPGLTAYACDYRYGRTRALIASMLKPQVVLICLGTNDIDQKINDSGSKTPVAALTGHLSNLASWWHDNTGAAIWFGTLLPRVQPGGEVQTVKPGFEPGGNADQINAALRDKSLFPAMARVIDGRALVQDPVDAAKWRTDNGPLTGDGTHPSDNNGIPWVAAHLDIAPGG